MDDTPIVGSLVVRGHTPGTWSVGRDGVPFGSTDVNVVSRTYRKCINANHVVASIRTVSDQWEANAMLISAAPDMLDVLRLIANADASSGERVCNCEDMAEGFKCENCLIWAAIDKAEGRAG